MLSTQLSQTIVNEPIEDNSIVRIDKYNSTVLNKNGSTKNVMVIVEMTVLHPGSVVGARIGQPESIENVQFNVQNSVTNGGTASTTNTSGLTAIQQRFQQDNNYNFDGLTHPINSLSPYQNKWVIKARVTSKGPIRTWNNAKGEGKLFSMDLKDETGEIRATAFREQVDKFYSTIEVDKVYYISKCQLKPANKQYSVLKNDYEMTFTADTIVQPCTEDDSSIPSIQYNYVPISSIAHMEPNAVVDVIGVVKTASELQAFTSRASGRELQKRDITLVDSSNASVLLTLWGEQAANFDQYTQPVVTIKSARVQEFNGGKTLSISAGGTMKLNPESDESFKLRRWFDEGNADNITVSVSAKTGGGGNYNSQWLTFLEAKESNLGAGEKPDYFQCKAMVHNVRSGNAVYKACPQPECNKKVTDQENGTYRCERCGQDFPNYKYRLLLSMMIGDWTSNRYVTAFQEVGEKLLGKTSDEVGEALEMDKEAAENIFQTVAFQPYLFRLRSKVEHYGDAPRNKVIVMQANPVNHAEYNAHLIKELQELTGIGKTSN